MNSPRVRSPVGSSWALKLALFVGTLSLYFFLKQEVAMPFTPRNAFMTAVVAALARHGQAQTVDLNWHAPNSTAINNLSGVIAGSGVYGFIYNSSTTPVEAYGTYNWCNMPHVRASEYKKPSSEYKLQYVEVVGHPKLHHFQMHH